MRTDTAFRFAGVNGVVARRLGAEGFRFADLFAPVCLNDVFALAAVDGFVATVLTAARFGGVAGAISMPNISERSSLASTFALARPVRFCERPDPAFVSKSCRST